LKKIINIKELDDMKKKTTLKDDISSLSDRYSRQVLFAPIGIKGQEMLAKSKIAIIGCGGLGSVLSSNMTRAGAGTLRIIDKDRLELSNLQRQLLFDEIDVRKKTPKVEAARNKLIKINSDIQIEAIFDEVDENNISDLIDGFDLVLDGTDNFKTRLVINRASVDSAVPFIYGAVAASFGMIYNVIPGSGVCLRCLFREEPGGENALNCNTVGIINTAVNIIASIQSTEALKLLTGNRDAMIKGLINIDIWDLSLDIIEIKKDSEYICPVCGDNDV
jgi:molybdopterin/thiamine biosynthesis adenylyltransferase